MARVVEKGWPEGSMTQRGVEIVVGRLVTDEAIRRRFRQAPAQALRELMALGIELSAVEQAALQSLDPSALQHFAQALDSRLQKAVLVAQIEKLPGDDQEDGA
jgi:hypothetical protein